MNLAYRVLRVTWKKKSFCFPNWDLVAVCSLRRMLLSLYEKYKLQTFSDERIQGFFSYTAKIQPKLLRTISTSNNSARALKLICLLSFFCFFLLFLCFVFCCHNQFISRCFSLSPSDWASVFVICFIFTSSLVIERIWWLLRPGQNPALTRATFIKQLVFARNAQNVLVRWRRLVQEQPVSLSNPVTVSKSVNGSIFFQSDGEITVPVLLGKLKRKQQMTDRRTWLHKTYEEPISERKPNGSLCTQVIECTDKCVDPR